LFLGRREKTRVSLYCRQGHEQSKAFIPHGYRASISVWCRLLSETAWGNQVRTFMQSDSVIEDKESLFYFRSGSFFLLTTGGLISVQTALFTFVKMSDLSSNKSVRFKVRRDTAEKEAGNIKVNLLLAVIWQPDLNDIEMDLVAFVSLLASNEIQCGKRLFKYFAAWVATAYPFIFCRDTQCMCVCMYLHHVVLDTSKEFSKRNRLFPCFEDDVFFGPALLAEWEFDPRPQ
jgi:hypothetical protein